MKTKNDDSVLRLNNGKYICCYCGKPLQVKHKTEWDEYDKYEWNEYECDCKEWNESIEWNNKLEKLNGDFYQAYCKYSKEFTDLTYIIKYKTNKKRYQLK